MKLQKKYFKSNSADIYLPLSSKQNHCLTVFAFKRNIQKKSCMFHCIRYNCISVFLLHFQTALCQGFGLLISSCKQLWQNIGPNTVTSMFSPLFEFSFYSVYFSPCVPCMDPLIHPEYLLLLLEQGKRSLKGHTRLYLLLSVSRQQRLPRGMVWAQRGAPPPAQLLRVSRVWRADKLPHLRRGPSVPPTPPWSGINHPAPQNSTLPAAPTPFVPPAPSGSFIPSAPPQSSVAPAPPRPSGSPSPPRPPAPSGPTWSHGSSQSPLLFGSPSPPWAPPPPALPPLVSPLESAVIPPP